MTDPRRAIPSVHRLAAQVEGAPSDVADASRIVLDDERTRVQHGADPSSLETLVERVRARLHEQERGTLRRAINATGVMLHTGLGRAPLATEAARAASEVAGSYAPVELDMTSGSRGSRHAHVARRLCDLTGAEGAVVVNNNAAALMLVLGVVAPGQGVAVARGELIEIGGSFRLPDIIESGGARLREVGTTNKCRAEDFERALVDAVAILRVHSSNYRVEGFTAMPEIPELATLAARWSIPLIHDIGSGLLSESVRFEIPADEPSASASIRDGADLVLFSGDKILSGPQCGIVVGKAEWIGRLASHPMMRAMRLDKIRLAALDRTLATWRDPTRARVEIPLLRMLGTTVDDLRARAERLAPSMGASIVETDATIGGGSVPGRGVPSIGLAIRSEDPESLMTRLRDASPPIIARIHGGDVILDLRTIDEQDDAHVVRAVQ